MDSMVVKRYPQRGYGRTLPDAFESVEKHVGSLGVIHFGKPITTLVNDKIRVTFRQCEGTITGWIWEIDR